MPKGCSVDGCESRHYALGLCNRHWQRQRYHAEPESRRERSRQYRARNRESVRAANRAWRKKNKAHVNAYNAAYRAANPDIVREASAAWYRRNPERAAGYVAKRKALLRGNRGEPYSRREVFERDGWRCGICGLQILPDAVGREKATIDHIVPISRGGADSWDNVQAAHFSCNSSKGAR